MRGPDNVVLHLEVVVEEFDGQIIVRLDPANLRSGQDYDIRFLGSKKIIDRARVSQVERGPIPGEQILETVPLKFPHDGTANESTMAGDKDFV